MTFTKHRVHVILRCMDCDWDTQDFIEGPKLASKHHNETGHHIVGEYGYAVDWRKGTV